MDDLIIRQMKEGEQKALIKTAKRAFPFFEGLFVGTPKRAMAAEHKGKIVGGIMYKNVNAGRKNIVYIAEAFVDPGYHGKGVGKKLYAETFDFIRNHKAIFYDAAAVCYGHGFLYEYGRDNRERKKRSCFSDYGVFSDEYLIAASDMDKAFGRRVISLCPSLYCPVSPVFRSQMRCGAA